MLYNIGLVKKVWFSTLHMWKSCRVPCREHEDLPVRLASIQVPCGEDVNPACGLIVESGVGKKLQCSCGCLSKEKFHFTAVDGVYNAPSLDVSLNLETFSWSSVRENLRRVSVLMGPTAHLIIPLK